MRTITVVGTSLAGFSAAQQLRAQGFDGRLLMVGNELHLPYDRPPLSKGFLTGKVDRAGLALGEPSDYDELEAEWTLGDPATRVHPASASIELHSGERIGTDGVVIATGTTARNLPGTEGVAGVHTLRTLEDAGELRDELNVGSPRVVVIGAGFIGAEVASSCVDLGLDVTIVEASELPLARLLGDGMAEACADLHRDHRTKLRYGTGVEGIRTSGGRAVAVTLTDGAEIPADVVVVGIGVRPNTGWLADAGIGLHDGVLCDAGGVTELPNIVGVGDVARTHNPELGHSVRFEHWTSASSQPRVAMRNLLAGATAENHAEHFYFWSDQYGVRIQCAGTVHPDDEVRIVDGSIEDRRFLAHYERDGQPVGLLSFNHPRAFGRARRQLVKPRLITASA